MEVHLFVERFPQEIVNEFNSPEARASNETRLFGHRQESTYTMRWQVCNARKHG